MRTLKLKEGIIYGPVNSRRLGASVGINLSPTSYKLCSFNCLYCHYGFTNEHTNDASPYRGDLPSVEQVRESLENWLKQNQIHINYITFSGNGEPCMHPQFDRIVEVALETKNRIIPQAKLAILSNSTCLDGERVRSGLRKLDVRIMKLDAGTEKTFREINRPPPGVRFEKVVQNLRELDDIIVQSVFVDGRVSNTEEGEVEAWAERISHIQPKEVQIYSIDRPSADKGLTLVTKDRLNQIAKKAEDACGIRVKVF
jgi:wyosine [tRNA(Phe)-imidazoG37] synthetase (radical SAM superfamily)